MGHAKNTILLIVYETVSIFHLSRSSISFASFFPFITRHLSLLTEEIGKTKEIAQDKAKQIFEIPFS